MQLTEILSIFFGALFSLLFYTFSLKKVFNLPMEKNKKNLILLLGLTILVSIINYYDKNVFKVAIIVPLLTIFYTYIYGEKVNIIFLNILFLTCYLLVGEILTGFLLTIINLDYKYVFDNLLGKKLGSLLILCITFILI